MTVVPLLLWMSMATRAPMNTPLMGVLVREPMSCRILSPARY